MMYVGVAWSRGKSSIDHRQRLLPGPLQLDRHVLPYPDSGPHTTLQLKTNNAHPFSVFCSARIMILTLTFFNLRHAWPSFWKNNDKFYVIKQRR